MEPCGTPEERSTRGRQVFYHDRSSVGEAGIEPSKYRTRITITNVGKAKL